MATNTTYTIYVPAALAVQLKNYLAKHPEMSMSKLFQEAIKTHLGINRMDVKVLPD